MRIFLASAFLAIALVSPVLATSSSMAAERGFPASIPHDFVTGARFYYDAAAGWFARMLGALGLSGRFTLIPEGGTCRQGSRCAPGLICLNACEGPDCAAYAKRCVKGPDRADVLAETAPCDATNLCGGETVCTRLCPLGVDCAEPDRCLKPQRPGGSCSAAADCRAACAKLKLPPLISVAWRASCTAGMCGCALESYDSGDARVACPAGLDDAMACPDGTLEGCTADGCASGDCAPRRTCLAAPSSGGTCFTDDECSDDICTSGSTSFCDASLNRCRCRSTSTTTVSCATAMDCSDAACGQGEVHACVSGSCACAPAGIVTSCTAAADCSANCPPSYAPACVDGACACQRVTLDVPTACTDVSGCAGVSCPAGYEKACLNATCACTRTSAP